MKVPVKGINPEIESGSSTEQTANDYNIIANGSDIDNRDAIWQRLEQLRIDETSQVIPDEPILLIGGEVALSEHQISSIVGKPKAGKGQTLALFLNGLLNGDSTDTIHSPLDSDLKRAIILDTEQSKSDAKRAIDAVDYLGGVHGRITVYPVRGFSVGEKCIALEELIKRKHETCKVFVLDGIGEIAKKGVNNEEEGIALYSWLLDLVEKYHVHIICFIHENKQDTNATGFLGGYLIKKGEISFNIEKKKKERYHIIKPDYERHAPLDDLYFTVSAEGDNKIVVPTLMDEPQQAQKITDARQIDDEKQKIAMNDIFTDDTVINKGILEEKIDYLLMCGRNVARTAIRYWVQKRWIVENHKGNKYEYKRIK